MNLNINTIQNYDEYHHLFFRLNEINQIKYNQLN